jgi:parallel beta-helix repeat protein
MLIYKYIDAFVAWGRIQHRLGWRNLPKRITLGVIVLLAIAGFWRAWGSVNVQIESSAVIRVPQDYLTIQEAVNAANPGDTILVASGTYYECVEINKSLTLIGENSNTTIIDGTIAPDVHGHIFLIQNTSSVTISNFFLRNGGWGVSLNRSRNCVISDNIMLSNWTPVKLAYSERNVIQCNIIKTILYGVVLEDSRENIISDNVISSVQLYGVGLWVSSDNVISDNEISGCQVGIYFTLDCSNNTIRGNMVSRNEVSGIHLLGVANNLIIANAIVNNYLGMYLAGNDNRIYHNNFINNTHQWEGIKANFWDNGKGVGNYWSNYNGEDLNGDRVGDTLLPHLEADYYPLVSLWKPLQGDVDGNGLVSMQDASWIAAVFGSQQGTLDWDPDADLNNDRLLDIFDVVIVGVNFGKTIQDS